MKYALLDKALVQWLQPVSHAHCGFKWITTGRGGSVPSKAEFLFPPGSLKEAGRADFFRGEDTDDPGNAALKLILEQCPQVQKITDVAGERIFHFDDLNTGSIGNFMEACLGGSFAAFTNSTRLIRREGKKLIHPGLLQCKGCQ